MAYMTNLERITMAFESAFGYSQYSDWAFSALLGRIAREEPFATGTLANVCLPLTVALPANY